MLLVVREQVVERKWYLEYYIIVYMYVLMSQIFACNSKTVSFLYSKLIRIIELDTKKFIPAVVIQNSWQSPDASINMYIVS
jgi:hypothetical protein